MNVVELTELSKLITTPLNMPLKLTRMKLKKLKTT